MILKGCAPKIEIMPFQVHIVIIFLLIGRFYVIFSEFYKKCGENAMNIYAI